MPGQQANGDNSQICLLDLVCNNGKMSVLIRIALIR